jgi:hypothetical protein
VRAWEEPDEASYRRRVAFLIVMFPARWASVSDWPSQKDVVEGCRAGVDGRVGLISAAAGDLDVAVRHLDLKALLAARSS